MQPPSGDEDSSKSRFELQRPTPAAGPFRNADSSPADRFQLQDTSDRNTKPARGFLSVPRQQNHARELSREQAGVVQAAGPG